MSINNKTEQAPVGLLEPYDIMGIYLAEDSFYDVGAIGTHSNVNKWAKYKPLKLWKTQENVIGMLNDTLNATTKKVTAAGTQRRKNLFGLKIPLTYIVQGSTSASYGNYSQGMLGKLLHALITSSSPDWNYKWQKPTGGAASPYRLTDFNGYQHDAAPINPDYNSASSGFLQVPIESINLNFDDAKKMTIGLGWPTQPGAITWNEMLKGVSEAFGLSGTWTFACEIYREEHFSTSASPTNAEIARYLGLIDGNGVQKEPIHSGQVVAEADIDLNGSPDHNQYVIDLSTDDFGINSEGFFSIVYGFYFYADGTPSAPAAAVLPPFKPIRRFWTTASFPFNLRCTAIGLYVGNAFTWKSTDHQVSGNCVGQTLSVGSDIWFKLECYKVDEDLTIYNSNFNSIKAIGDYGAFDSYDIKICDANGSVISNASVTFSKTNTTVFYIKCVGAVPVGTTTQFILKFQKTASMTPTEMGTAFVNLVRTS